MRHDLPPTEGDMDKQMNMAHELARPEEQHCPVCNSPLFERRGRLMCFSEICLERTIESCDGC